MLSEDELTRLMAEAGETFEVPSLELDDVVAAPRLPFWQRSWVQTAASVAAVAVLLAGVGTMIGKSGSTIQGTASDAYDRDQSGGPAGGLAGGGTTGMAPSLPESPANGYQGGVAAPNAPSEPDARVVKTGEIRLLVDDGKVSTTVSRVQAVVVGLRGFVSESSTEEAIEHPSATMTVRVPVASFERLVEQVRGLGAKVESQTASGKDVTESYADTQAQIRSLKAARERYLSILARARTIAETVTVQQKVDEVQGQIDRLEGQRRVLANQSDYGTLQVSVAEEGAESEVFSEDGGWGEAWDDAKDGFTGGVQGILGASGRALLLLICAAVLVALGRLGWRVARRRMV